MTFKTKNIAATFAWMTCSKCRGDFSNKNRTVLSLLQGWLLQNSGVTFKNRNRTVLSLFLAWDSCEWPLPPVLIHFAIWRNILCNLEKYILPIGQIQNCAVTLSCLRQLWMTLASSAGQHRRKSSHLLQSAHKHNSQFGQIHFEIWKNTFCQWDKYIVKF